MKYRGFVASCKPHPDNAQKTLWAVKIQSGPQTGRIATVDLDNIPEGVAVGMDVEFERVVSKGPKGGLVAYNVTLTVRSRNEEKAETERSR